MKKDETKAWFSYAADAPATWRPVHAGDTVQIWEEKWQATLLISVFTASMPAKLTRVQLRRHSRGRALRWLKLPAAHVLIRPKSVPGGTGGYVADTSATYEKPGLKLNYVHFLQVIGRSWRFSSAWSKLTAKPLVSKGIILFTFEVAGKNASKIGRKGD